MKYLKFSFLALISLGLISLPAITSNAVASVSQTQSTALERGYRTGYSDGYNAGYRTSWDCATGVVSAPVFEDNVKAWSGDHCIDPRLVPGIFFSTKKIDSDDPALIDIAPTALQLFGIEVPPHMDGKPLYEQSSLTRD